MALAAHKQGNHKQHTHIIMSTKSGWTTLRQAPVASSRTDDIWFFDKNNGWLCNSSGYIARTRDGGQYWDQMHFVPPGGPNFPYLRSMSWSDRQNGYVGMVTGISANTPDAEKPAELLAAELNAIPYSDYLLVQTRDGGETWNWVPLPPGSPPGICGIHAVPNSGVAYGSGTNDPGLKPPAVVKTVDYGANWEVIPMDEHADNLIDIFFFDENHGFVVGGKNSDSCPTSDPAYPFPRLSRYVQLRPVVLETTDGGKTWVNRTQNLLDDDSLKPPQRPACGEWGWKIQFLPDKKHGFVSLENFRGAAILKTTDGGQTWERKHVAADQGPDTKPINNDLEGIGFLTAKKGWVGGWGNNFNGFMNSYTEDGGETWVRQDYNPTNPPAGDPRYRINRYRFVDNVGYCSGQLIYKLKHGKAFGGKTTFGTSKKKEAFAADQTTFGKSTVTSKPDRADPAHGGQAGEGGAGK